MCRVHFHQATNYEQIKSKNRKKTHVIILALEKVTQLVALALVAAKKKKAIINSKSATLLYFDKWKKKQQDQGGKYFYFSFISQF